MHKDLICCKPDTTETIFFPFFLYSFRIIYIYFLTTLEIVKILFTLILQLV